MKRIALITGTVVALLATLVLAGAAGRPDLGSTSAKAVIPGCQTITMNDSVPPFPMSVNWKPDENGHDYGSYRISGNCGQQLNAELLGIGPDSGSGRCAILFLHLQRDDGSWSRTTTVHDCTGGSGVRVAGFLPINHRFYLHCADSERDPLENQPCRVRFRF